MPLSERLAKKSAADQRCAIIASMHNPLESTYDIDYSVAPVQGSGGITQRTVSSGDNPFVSKNGLGSNNHSAAGMIAANRKSDSVGPFGRRSYHSSSAANPATATTASDCGLGDGCTIKAAAADVHEQTQQLSAGSGDPSSQWESESHAASRAVQPVQRLNFYASVRKEEQVDDDNRGGLVGATQRAIDIRTKRATAPEMCPPPPCYRAAEPVEMPLIAAQEKRLIRRNYLDLVECEHTNPDTEQQMGFDQAPEGRLPGSELSWELPVQSKAITHMGTSEDLFRGSAKCLDHRPVGYAGHVPTAERNLEVMRSGGEGEDVRRVFAKSHMTLAVHGGGVDATVTSSNLRARHRGGKNAPAPKMLNPKSEDDVLKTVEGAMLHQAIHQIVDAERSMNIRDDKRAMNYF